MSRICVDAGLRRTLESIRRVVKSYLKSRNSEFVPGKSKIPLNTPSFGVEEILEAVDSLLTTRVTMGEKVKKFEEDFAKYIGARYGVMVNSGSSANLLALFTLANPPLKGLRNSQIIAPAVTWSTTIFPIANVGAVPFLVDIELETYDIAPEQIRNAVDNNTSGIIPVHLLGNPCAMDAVMDIAKEHDLFVVEDACEAHGAEFKGRRVGTFGDMSTFSFFFSHHITTIEGGMLLTDNEEYAEIARALRAHGWVRDLKHAEQIAANYPSIDKRFLFINPGFNLRPTEIQGAFGIHQLKRLEDFIRVRRENAEYFTKELEAFSDFLILPRERPGTRHVWFGYPITVRHNAPFTKEKIVGFLEEKGIETRPIMAGNMAEQPAIGLLKCRISDNLENSRFVLRNSFFIGNHQGIRDEQREYMVRCLKEFLKKETGVTG